MKKLFKIFISKRYILIVLLLTTTYCAYYNTFFNAEENYRIGLEKKNNSETDNISNDIRTNFESAISKSWTVIKVYGDSNSWADDALLLIGKSHYHLKEYDKSQAILEQFLQKYLRSPLKSEAELWLAQTFVQQGNIDEALKSFTTLISNTTDDNILANAYFNIGEIYFNSKDYEQAINNYSLCIESASSSEIAGNAQYKLADSYFNSKDFENAVTNYQLVLQYDLPISKQFDAVIQMSNSLMELGRFEQAKEMLLNILSDQRFKIQYSMIATKLANMVEFQGDTEFAIEKYYQVLEDYPKSEGAALSSFYIAQIYEFEYGWLDSAKVKYENVKKLYSKSESVEEANERAKILSTYQTIRNNLRKDKEDIYKLEHGDSSLVDSLETGLDTVLVQNNIVENEADEISEVEISEEGVSEETEEDEADVLNRARRRLSNSDDEIAGAMQVTKVKKTAITRKPEQVEASLLKNSYNIAEFFLLNYQQYDSAKVYYLNFINNFTDSLLTPKAYYSLYYIYNDISHDTLKADSIKSLILSKYPETVYGKKLSGTELIIKEKVNLEIKNMFRRAEDLVDSSEYQEAIVLYNQIAEQDSGSLWAQKSRYAAAYIYENYLNNITKALESYAVLAREYPLTEQGKIASAKIAEPPLEVIESDTTFVDSVFNKPVSPDSTNNIIKHSPDSLINLKESNE